MEETDEQKFIQVNREYDSMSEVEQKIIFYFYKNRKYTMRNKIKS